jgi:hypothetical protein
MLIEPAAGPALHSGCVFGVRASVFSVDLTHVEIAGATSMAGVRASVFSVDLAHVEIAGATLMVGGGGGGGGLCILGVLAEPPSAAKAMRTSKSRFRNHNFLPQCSVH